MTRLYLLLQSDCFTPHTGCLKASNTVTKSSPASIKLIITSTSDGAQCIIVSLVWKADRILITHIPSLLFFHETFSLFSSSSIALFTFTCLCLLIILSPASSSCNPPVSISSPRLIMSPTELWSVSIAFLQGFLLIHIQTFGHFIVIVSTGLLLWKKEISHHRVWIQSRKDFFFSFIFQYSSILIVACLFLFKLSFSLFSLLKRDFNFWRHPLDLSNWCISFIMNCAHCLKLLTLKLLNGGISFWHEIELRQSTTCKPGNNGGFGDSEINWLFSKPLSRFQLAAVYLSQTARIPCTFVGNNYAWGCLYLLICLNSWFLSDIAFVLLPLLFVCYWSKVTLMLHFLSIQPRERLMLHHSGFRCPWLVMVSDN